MSNSTDPDIIIARDFGRGFTSFSSSVIFVILVLELLSLYQRRKIFFGKSRNRESTLPTLALAAVTIAGFIEGLCGGMLWYLDWTNAKEACNVYASALTVGYIMMKQVIYLYLYERLSVVHASMNFTHYSVNLIRKLTLFSIVVGIPVAFYPVTIIYFGGHVSAEGVCIQYTTNVAPVLAFAISDVGFSSLMLFLFVIPLTRFAQVLIHSESKRNALYAIAWKNLVYSCIIMSSTIFMLLFMAISEFQLHNDADGNRVGFTYLHVLHSQFTEVDILINVVVSHVISTKWIPRITMSSAAVEEGQTYTKIHFLDPGSSDDTEIILEEGFLAVRDSDTLAWRILPRSIVVRMHNSIYRYGKIFPKTLLIWTLFLAVLNELAFCDIIPGYVGIIVLVFVAMAIIIGFLFLVSIPLLKQLSFTGFFITNTFFSILWFITVAITVQERWDRMVMLITMFLLMIFSSFGDSLVFR